MLCSEISKRNFCCHIVFIEYDLVSNKNNRGGGHKQGKKLHFSALCCTQDFKLICTALPIKLHCTAHYTAHYASHCTTHYTLNCTVSSTALFCVH